MNNKKKKRRTSKVKDAKELEVEKEEKEISTANNKSSLSHSKNVQFTIKL